jgi:hypothetical protein
MFARSALSSFRPVSAGNDVTYVCSDWTTTDSRGTIYGPQMMRWLQRETGAREYDWHRIVHGVENPRGIDRSFLNALTRDDVCVWNNDNNVCGRARFDRVKCLLNWTRVRGQRISACLYRVTFRSLFTTFRLPLRSWARSHNDNNNYCNDTLVSSFSLSLSLSP